LEPDAWIIQLRDGSEIEVLAHGYRVEDDECVFSLLFEGSPARSAEDGRVVGVSH
jgi:hypothetical protein